MLKTHLHSRGIQQLFITNNYAFQRVISVYHFKILGNVIKFHFLYGIRKHIMMEDRKISIISSVLLNPTFNLAYFAEA